MKNRVITISREFGSGGRTIGKKVAEQLGIPCYDAEIIQAMAQETGFAPDYVQEAGEYAPGGFLSSAFSNRMFGPTNEDILWEHQYKVITDLAAKGPCVIVGRCADYVLRDDPNVALVNLFVHAPMAARIRRESARTNTTPIQAEKRIRQVDKERASYYNFFSSKRWGDAQGYDLCVNTGNMDISDVVQLTLRYLELRGLR